MGKKRKSDASRLDEVDRTMYGAFRGAANSLSQLYTHAMNHQRVSFLAGERRGLEKLYQWIVRQEEEGTRVTTDDITTYLQNELEYEPEETSIQAAPMQEFHHNHQFAPPNVHTSSAAHFPYDFNQEKPLTQPTGLSSPVRRTLQGFNLRDAEPDKHHHPNSSNQGLF
ncbi:Holocarboxylase synthetase [Hirschfeldia incana]|nr:Holocarboxylase synthetase [Hirschfeldia incana]